MPGTAEQNLSLFRELITCGHELYFWEFDGEFTPIYTNCPEARFYRQLLGITSHSLSVLRKASDGGRPVAMTNQPGLVWIADFAMNEMGGLHRVYAIGPVFVEDISLPNLEAALKGYDLFGGEKSELRDFLLRLPVLSITRFYDYGLMLHYCITGEKISFSEFQYPEAEQSARKRAQGGAGTDSHGTWVMEQELLRLVEEGNLDYKKQTSRMVSTGNPGQLGNGDPVRNLKNLAIVFTALCTRAAIRGGLTPEIAYTLSDQYISAIETGSTLSEVAEVNAAMQDDFVQRVHQCKVGGISPQVRNCMNYLQVHLTEKISVPELAAKMGYSASHLTKLFKREVGTTINEYVMSLKMEQAKDALRLTGESVQSICHRLGFGSQSYFGKQFKAATGMTPMEYREKQGNK